MTDAIDQSPPEDPRLYLRYERIRTQAAKRALVAGMELGSEYDGELTRFYKFVADYLVLGQTRLIQQDQRLAALLKERVASDQLADHALIDALIERLATAGRALERFSSAIEEFRGDGAAGRPAFELAAADYLDFLNNVLGARRHSLQHLTGEFFDSGDWARISDRHDAHVKKELDCFAAAQDATPAEIREAFNEPTPGSRRGTQ